MNSLIYGFLIIFFFFKQKTAYEMRISDWSSDVCSSDLALARRTPGWPSGMANSMDERTFACQKPNVHGCVEKNTSPLLYPCSLALIRGKSALASQIHPLARGDGVDRSEEHTSELQSLMRISYAVFCLNKKTTQNRLINNGYAYTTILTTLSHQ